MALIHGLAAHAAGAELLPYKYDPGELKPDEVEVAVTHCGIGYSDLNLINNDWGISQYPFIPGHEIIGTVVDVGSAVKTFKPDQRVGIGWQSNSCGTCEWCLQGKENLCAESEATSVHRNGGFAGAVRANARFVIPIPEKLNSENAAPLLCAGVTVYNPMRSLGVNPSSRVGIIGIGGLGHIAVQFARAFGAEVTAFSTSSAKEEEAFELGAHNFVNTQESKALKQVAGSFDVILSTINTAQDWMAYITALRPTGTLCFVGIPQEPAAITPFSLIAGTKSITGTPGGSPRVLREMLDVAARHGVQAKTESFAMHRANEAIAKVKRNAMRYRAVLTN
jgi:alcohol/geraniol dehydrogenase (NADP+)